VTANSSLTLAELQGLMYKTVANANNSTPANLSWTVTDNGTSPQSINETLGITVNPVNDAPTLTATPAILNFTEGAGSTQTAAVNVFSGTTINTVESGQTIISRFNTPFRVHQGGDFPKTKTNLGHA